MRSVGQWDVYTCMYMYVCMSCIQHPISLVFVFVFTEVQVEKVPVPKTRGNMRT